MVSPIVQTGLIYLAARGFAVLLFYLILIDPYLNKITNETFGGILRIIVFIISLAFVIGGGKGVMKVGELFSFRRN